ncbi:opine metallophore biosynthesis dehydrogenase [Paenibacillus sp. y28]|uniref:opine metallophore biosynthesis dehydrogenase n=1 Tax=Paenibacillus sp. y28 TaxID=3129110 RepID=UPI003015E5EF
MRSLRAASPFGNTLLIGAGPAGIHVAVDMSRGWSNQLGLLNRQGSHSTAIRKQLEQNAYTVSTVVQVESRRHLSGEAMIDRFYEGYDQIEDKWQTLILCTPSDSYISVIHDLNLNALHEVRTIFLLSPGIASNLLVQSLLGTLRDRIEIISFSTYYAATKFSPGHASVIKSFVKGMKRKIAVGSNKPESRALSYVQQFLQSLGIKCEAVSCPIEAEFRNITTYVHPPFFINSFSLNEIFKREASRKFMYKLYPEGPITPHTIRAMRLLWREISAVALFFNAMPLNLLKFLNDDNYPVHEITLSRDEIEHFVEMEESKQEYLLYVRYASILIDPFSMPDENGKYFDFSAVPYKQVTKNIEGKWRIPRIPYEDYKKLKLLCGLAKKADLAMPQAVSLTEMFEDRLRAFIREVGSDFIQPEALKDTTADEVSLIFTEWRKMQQANSHNLQGNGS